LFQPTNTLHVGGFLLVVPSISGANQLSTYNFYLALLVVSTFKVSTLTKAESTLQESTLQESTRVESEVLVLVEEPLPHDDNTATTHKAKTNFFIFFVCFLICYFWL